MHPLATLMMTELHQQELLHEAEVVRRGRAAYSAGTRPLRERVGYLLVHAGLRLAVAPRAAVSR
jgi:hypothetical protein